MNIDSRADRGLPVTPDEQIVADKVLGLCTHRDWTEFKDKRGDRTLVCSSCGEEFAFREPDGDWSTREPSVSPSKFLLRCIPHAAIDEVLAATVARRVETGGWAPMTLTTPSGFVQRFTKNGIRFESGAHRTKAEAICEAAAKLCRAGNTFVR